MARACSGAESPAQPAPVHPAPPAANSGEDDLWGSFEAFSAAVAAEVDQRIAAARLRPPLGPSSEYPRRQQPQGQEPAQPCREPAPEAASQEQPSRRPLGSLQQVSVPAGQARKRGRSSHDAPPLAAAEAQDGRPAGQRRAAAAPLPVPAPPAGSPACKRQRPHVAFGTRCDAPRTTRSLKPVRLDAAQAPTPPQLPSAAPAVADRQGAKGPAAGSAAAAASGVPRPDLLRSLGTALAGRDGIPSGKTAGEQASRGAGTAAPAVLLNSMGGAGQLQQLLGDLTAALHGLQPSSVAEAALSGDAHGSSVHAVLQQQGITAVEAQDASSLLQVCLCRMALMLQRAVLQLHRGHAFASLASKQATHSHASVVPSPPPPQIVLDRMDAIAARPASPPAVAPPVAASEQLLPAAAAAAASDGGPPPSASCVPASLPGPAAPDTAQTDALCCRLSHLLDSSGAQLQDVGAGLAAALHAEARLQRIGAAAMEAALAGAESAVACMAREPAAAPAAAMAQPQAEPRPSTFAGRPAEQPASPPLAGSLSLAPGEPPACSVIVAPHRAQPAAAHEGEMHHKHVEQQPARQPTTAAEPTEDANQPVPAQLLPSTDMPAAVRSAPIGCPAPTQPSMVCAAIGIPLELPSQPQWLLPWGGSSGLMLQPQSAVVPGFPAYGALHQDQQQAQQEGQGDASFSVASDEELEDEPPKETSSASASEASASPACTGMVPPVDLAASKEQDGGGQQGQEQQALLDDMAALAIAQYRQVRSGSLFDKCCLLVAFRYCLHAVDCQPPPNSSCQTGQCCRSIMQLRSTKQSRLTTEPGMLPCERWGDLLSPGLEKWWKQATEMARQLDAAAPRRPQHARPHMPPLPLPATRPALKQPCSPRPLSRVWRCPCQPLWACHGQRRPTIPSKRRPRRRRRRGESGMPPAGGGCGSVPTCWRSGTSMLLSWASAEAVSQRRHSSKNW